MNRHARDRNSSPRLYQEGRGTQTWVAALESIPVTGQVLIISHGRIIETGLVTCLPPGDFAAWGMPFQHGEDVRLGYEQGQFTLVEWLRGEG
jgi:broad specificity phosphatase PhoE